VIAADNARSDDDPATDATIVQRPVAATARSSSDGPQCIGNWTVSKATGVPPTAAGNAADAPIATASARGPIRSIAVDGVAQRGSFLVSFLGRRDPQKS
jgi:hypothetical protein